MKKRSVPLALAALMAVGSAEMSAKQDYAFKLPKVTDVKVTNGFWLPRLETNRLVTLKTDFEKCEEARIPNFKKAAKRENQTFKGIPFDDSDVYKVIEGAAYSLATHPDPKLEAYVDDLIGWMARAQEKDGYLYTARTLGMEKVNGFRYRKMMGAERWSHLAHSHELYNVGHMYEAAVAYFEATGKRTLLDVAVRSADLIDKVFGPAANQLKETSGHQEIELALCRLYRATGDARYLKLAEFLLEMRGRGRTGNSGEVFTQEGTLAKGGELGAPGSYNQNHLPVTKQREAVGHAVRATYLYCGMADVAALTGNEAYLKAIDALWSNVVEKKLHLNGSVGARRRGEAFGAAYELPNEKTYLETCAGIGNALWNMRMFLLHGDAKYIDVLERAIYNGILSGVSISGDEFFYPNPLASSGGYKRSKWFSCSCCPVNVVRFIPQVPTFAYATRDDEAYVNLFMASEATLKLGSGNVKLAQKTDYPWCGDVVIDVTPPRDNARFTLNVRIPGWCTGRPVPGSLYTHTRPGSIEDFKVSVNGKPFEFKSEKGYCTLAREWKKGDRVTVSMQMPVRRVRANMLVKDDAGRLAVERGPILYCAEAVDNGGKVLNKVLVENAPFAPIVRNIAGHNFPAFTAPASVVRAAEDGKTLVEPTSLTLVPYFAWCHRGDGEMQTWFPSVVKAFPMQAQKTLEASFCCKTDRVDAAMDGLAPSSSADRSIPRLTFWPHLGTEEWVSCTFAKPREIKGVETYWYSDLARKGQCHMPLSWRVQWKDSDNGDWRDIPGKGEIDENRFCVLNFPKPVKAKALRLVVRQREGWSSGLLEWRVR